MAHAIVCSHCGSKIAATRDRCPRCRREIARPDPAAAAARSRKLARGTGIFVGAALATLGLLWMTRDAPPEPTVTAKPADPLASRRQPRQDAPAAAVSADYDFAKQSAFMDASDRGAVSYKTGDYAGALAQFEAAVAKNPRDAESLSNLGQILVRLGRTAEAIPFFERACSLMPERWAFRFNLARAHALLQQWDQAVDSYRLAQTLFPDDYVTTFNLALTLHKQGNEAGAVEEYKKAVTLNPEDASFRMALAISYEALQQKQDAAAAYTEYLRLAPTASDAEKVRTRIALLTGQPAPASPSGL